MNNSKASFRNKPFEGNLDKTQKNKYFPKRIIEKGKTIKFEKLPEAKPIEEIISPYFPSEDLKAAVHYARLLERPLIIRGEPGCGKTKLAQALAYELYGKSYRDHYFEWNIKSTTKAVEGIYNYDYLGRMRAIHELSLKNKSKNPDDPEFHLEDIDKKKFREFGPLGKAILLSTKDDPSILLIDEIDKADIDFPNDLLLELDQKRFKIEETGEEFTAEGAPIIIITSNDEKELPNAFLRRCVFHYIEFPDRARLLKIVDAKVKFILNEFSDTYFSKKIKPLSKTLQAEIVDIFNAIYKAAKVNPSTDKVPSTSELLDWLKVIHYTKLKNPSRLKGGKMPKDQLLFVEVLFKSLDDQNQAIKNYPYLIKKIKTPLKSSKGKNDEKRN